MSPGNTNGLPLPVNEKDQFSGHWDQYTSNQRKRLQPSVPARINQQHMAFEPAGRMRLTSDQGRSRARVGNSLWGYLGASIRATGVLQSLAPAARRLRRRMP